MKHKVWSKSPLWSSPLHARCGDHHQGHAIGRAALLIGAVAKKPIPLPRLGLARKQFLKNQCTGSY